MNYLQQISQRIDIALNGYKTPPDFFKKQERQYRQQNYVRHSKLLTILGNPPYGKETRRKKIKGI